MAPSVGGAAALGALICSLLAIPTMPKALAQTPQASAGAAVRHSASSTANASSDVFAAREQDWRNGAIVYQVIVDRFAPPADHIAKAALYPAPKRLRRWDEEPRAGHYVEAAKVWSHEIDFWGGDFSSLRGKLDHVQKLGADVLYLNPIHLGYTNHKYDSLDFQAVSPEYGTREDVKALAHDVHARGMKLILDGVFNHMGRQSPAFMKAQASTQASTHPWFVFGPQFPGGARTWKNVQNLPELNLEHKPVRDHLWNDADSVVRSYLRDGVDGWRLDTAYELGPVFLAELTQAAHHEKPGSLVVGEIVNHPGGWMPAMDAVMNFHWRTLLLKMLAGEISARQASLLLNQTVKDVGLEPLLKSWLLLDNHDVPRLHTEVPDAHKRHLAQVLQFTLPGSPNLYYGSEFGMKGGHDPEQRAPMRWDLARDDNPEWIWMRSLVDLRKSQRALRVGNFRRLEADQLLAFERYTDRVADTIIVISNPNAHAVTETIALRNGMLMDDAAMEDLIHLPTSAAPGLASPANPAPVKSGSGFISVSLPPYGVRVLRPDFKPDRGYSVYKRVP